MAGKKKKTEQAPEAGEVSIEESALEPEPMSSTEALAQAEAEAAETKPKKPPKKTATAMQTELEKRVEALELKLTQAAEQMTALLNQLGELVDRDNELAGRVAFLEGVLGEEEPEKLDKVLDAATWIEGKTETKPGDDPTPETQAEDADFDEPTP